jgi:hypothetical protein
MFFQASLESLMKRLALGLTLAAASATASAQAITFDDVRFTNFPANFNGYSLNNLPSFGTNYASLQWSPNFNVLRATGYSDRVAGAPANNGFINGLVSGDYVAYNGGAAPVSFEALTTDGLFNFNSVYMGAAWYSNLSVAVQGFRDGVEVYNTAINGLSFVDSVFVNFGWTNIDKVSFTSLSGPAGNPVDNLSTYNRAFVMDNLSVSAVPEPETYALMLAGLGLISAAAARRRSNKS